MKWIKSFIKLLLIVFVMLFLTAGYSWKVEPFLLFTYQYQLNKSENENGTEVKVVQLSDLEISEHYSEKQLNRLVKKINELKPDIIVFTGDLFNNFSQYAPVKEVTEALQAMKATYGKYAVWGNHDIGGGAVRQYETILKSADFILLENSSDTIKINEKDSLFIAGLDDSLLGSPDMDVILNEMDWSTNYKILLLHEPDIVDNYNNLPFDLILAGHSHGGQVKIPFTKGVRTRLAEKYLDGFYEIGEEGKTLLYVNTGIGTSRIPIRFLVFPEIPVFTIFLS